MTFAAHSGRIPARSSDYYMENVKLWGICNWKISVLDQKLDAHSKPVARIGVHRYSYGQEHLAYMIKHQMDLFLILGCLMAESG